MPDFSWDELRDKRVLGGRKGGMPEMVFEYILKNHNIDPASIWKSTRVLILVPQLHLPVTCRQILLLKPSCEKKEKASSGFSGRLLSLYFLLKNQFSE